MVPSCDQKDLERVKPHPGIGQKIAFTTEDNSTTRWMTRRTRQKTLSTPDPSTLILEPHRPRRHRRHRPRGSIGFVNGRPSATCGGENHTAALASPACARPRRPGWKRRASVESLGLVQPRKQLAQKRAPETPNGGNSADGIRWPQLCLLGHNLTGFWNSIQGESKSLENRRKFILLHQHTHAAAGEPCVRKGCLSHHSESTIGTKAS